LAAGRTRLCWAPDAAGAPAADGCILQGVPSLLQRRLVFVTGKGGVGKSTVATALGVLAARSGLRTIVAELGGNNRAQRAFDRHGEASHEVELAPGLFTISIDPQHAMEEYLRLRVGALGHVLAASRMFHAFAMATPGMRELLSIGKIWELAQLERRAREGAPYDFVVVDAPATGHGVGFLQTPRTFAEIARVGPIATQAGKISATIADRSFTGVIAVSTPEEMPVTETLALRDELAPLQLAIDAVILNARYLTRFQPQDVPALQAALRAAGTPRARAALRAALSQQTRCLAQSEQQQRLEQAFGAIVSTLPFVFSASIGVAELQGLADVLGTALR
jgi:anion-transporting  ArsA/GET3 family ATPase